MKPNLLLTGMLAVATIVATSCSAPRLAQQSNIGDDVYNTTAKAVEYTEPLQVQDDYNDGYDDNGYDDGYDDGYGTSDPYSDMDYSSRINRFNYGNSFMPYFDPYYDGGFGYNSFYPGYGSGYGFGLGLGFGFGWGSPFYNSWYSPYSWGGYDPFWGFNNYYGGAYGGFYGGGYYGGGFYGGRSYNSPRPYRGRENGVGDRSYLPDYSNRGQGVVRTTNGVINNSARRGDRTNAPQDNTSSRPARTQNYTPPQRTESRPSYTPPSSFGGGGRGSMGGGMGGGGRSSRGGRN